MQKNFIGETIHVNDIVVYLRNERVGSSTIRKCKFVGQVVGFTTLKVKIKQLSNADQYVQLSQYEDHGVVSVYSNDVICVL